jgi:hypothetical protein
MNLTETGCENADGIKLAQDVVQWQDLVNTIMKLLFP